MNEIVFFFGKEVYLQIVCVCVFFFSFITTTIIVKGNIDKINNSGRIGNESSSSSSNHNNGNLNNKQNTHTLDAQTIEISF